MPTNLCERYGVPPGKIVQVPNGVDVHEIQPATPEQRLRAREELGLPADRPVLIFIGSGYLPNTEAAAFLVANVAPAFPQCTIAIAGSVRDSYAASRRPSAPPNVIWMGIIDRQQRRALYQAADLALNPMFSGSGTNLKMLDYFAAGLPVVSTPAGARGLNVSSDECVVCTAEEFVSHIGSLLADAPLRAKIGQRARQLAVTQFDWAAIAQKAADAMLDLLKGESANVT